MKWLAIPSLVVGAILVTGLIGPNAFATNPDFRIVDFGVNKGQGGPTPFITVAGEAGGTTPGQGSTNIYAYVFVTNKGIFAVASHSFIDSGEQTPPPPDLIWHAHKVTLDGSGCITSITDDGEASLSGNTVSLTGTQANKVDAVLTAKLTVSEAGVCVDEVFDSAP